MEDYKKKLEEVSKKYSSCIYLEEVLSDDDKEVLKERLVNTFKAGADWQKQQMMKDAVDADARYICGEGTIFDPQILPDEIEVGQKVKLIIIKED